MNLHPLEVAFEEKKETNKDLMRVMSSFWLLLRSEGMRAGRLPITSLVTFHDGGQMWEEIQRRQESSKNPRPQ